MNLAENKCRVEIFINISLACKISRNMKIASTKAIHKREKKFQFAFFYYLREKYCPVLWCKKLMSNQLLTLSIIFRSPSLVRSLLSYFDKHQKKNLAEKESL